MMTPDESLKRVLEAVDELALRLSHTTPDRQQAFLQQFEANVRAQWRDVFSPVLSSEDVDGMVTDVASRVRGKRDHLEGLGGGTA